MKLQAEAIPEIPPLWEKFPYFFSLLRQPEMLLFIGFGSLSLFVMLKYLLGMLLILPLLVFMWVFGGYLFDTLLRIAHGHLDPKDAPQSGYGGMGLAARALVLLLLDCLLAGTVDSMIRGGLPHFAIDAPVQHPNLLLSLTLLGIGLLIKPAQVILLAQSRSILRALNPLRIAATIAACGSRYVLILVFDYVLNGSTVELFVQSAGYLPPWALVIVFNTLVLGSWLISMAMIGYVCLERHGDLDIRISEAAGRNAGAERGRKHDPLAGILAEAGGLVGDGDTVGALRLLRTALDRNWGQERLHAQFFKLALLNDEAGDALAMGRNYVGTLVHTGKMPLALQWYQRCVEVSPGFRPANLGDLLPLAIEAERSRADDLALRLVERMVAEDDSHAQIPDALLVKLRVLLSRRDMVAATALQQMLNLTYPEHPATALAERYLNPGKTVNAAAAAG